MRVHLLRHAHAGDAFHWIGDDDLRPLTKKGRRQCERLGDFLEAYGVRPDVIVSSPLVRAQQTAEIVAATLGMTVKTDRRLGAGFGKSELWALLDELGAREPMFVGHDPDLSSLRHLPHRCAGISMKKGALATIDLQHQARRRRGRAALAGAAGAAGGRLEARALGKRQREAERGAGSLGRLQPDAAPVGLGDVARDGQAQAGAAEAALPCPVDLVEALEDAQPDPLTGMPTPSSLTETTTASGCSSARDRHGAALARELDGVVQQVHEQLVEYAPHRRAPVAGRPARERPG